MKKGAVEIVLGAKPGAVDDDGDDVTEEKSEYSDEELGAAEELASAVSAGEPEAIVDAFKALKAACEATYSDEE